MEIREIRQHQLQSYIDSPEYKAAKYIAISKHRALSHIRNPRVKPNDLVLVLIYEKGEMVAYLGVFADDLHFSTGIEHVGWLSCMWVNPIMRGKGIAKKLIQTVFEAWDYKILVTEFTPAAHGLYNRTEQFLDLAKPQGVRGYLRLNLAYLLPKKEHKWNKWKPFLSCMDGVFNLFNALRLKWYQNTTLTSQGISFEYLSEIDDEAWAFIQKNKANELMNRSRTDLTWLVKNPWLLSSNLKDHNAKRYHFSATDSSFTFLNIKVYDRAFNMLGFLIVSIRGGNMKIPYAYLLNGAEEQVLSVVYEHMLAAKLDMLTVFHPALVKAIQEKQSPFFKKRTFKRHYIIGKVLGEQLAATPDFVIQDGDADAAFT
ncbi:GNAT family N-acetyltransferase [Aureispira sp. CCB-QB1]|uniref:GNAT family N-acetyltransferase n=1 Tax=Aureispira sp. CCB-QB1 TaxID=1313421 RepID=UPI0006986E05|nr:GNAT family N-acetyltransferase [Aureispira sp. CCB-QB1]